jgi:DNA-binding NtrC family response regulator
MDRTDPGNEKTRTKAIRVLVVDDEPIQLETICRGLFLYGYAFDKATNSEDAIRILSNGNAVDIMLTDLNMPGKSGIQLIEKALNLNPRLPIIAITGLSYSPQVDAIQELGVPILPKPFDPEMLDREIKKSIEDKTQSN